MRNALISLAVLVIFVTLLGGCATGRKQTDLETQGLKNQVSVLETQLQSKDDEIKALRESLSVATEQKYEETKSQLSTDIVPTKVVAEIKSRRTAKQIQTALNNAGYNPGVIDGKIGKQTKEAIRQFQKANNLTADGHVGKKTWSRLREYLDKKVK